VILARALAVAAMVVACSGPSKEAPKKRPSLEELVETDKKEREGSHSDGDSPAASMPSVETAEPDALTMLRSVVDDACACADLECFRKALEKLQDMPKSEATPNDDEKQEGMELAKRLQECAQSVISGP